MKCKFFLYHSLLCIEFVSMTSLSSFRSSSRPFVCFKSGLHCISKLAAALSSANCAVPPGTFLTTLYFRFWASNLPLPFYSCLKIQLPSVLSLLCTSCLEEMIRGTYSSAHIISHKYRASWKENFQWKCIITNWRILWVCSLESWFLDHLNSLRIKMVVLKIVHAQDGCV